MTRERTNLKLKIRCDLVSAVAGIGFGQSISLGLLSQMQSAIGAATTLLAGCIYAAGKVKEYGPINESLKVAEAEFKDNAAYGLHNFYERLGAISKG